MSLEGLTEFLKLVTPPAAAAAAVAAVREIMKLVAARRAVSKPASTVVVLPPGVSLTPEPVRPGPLRQTVALVSRSIGGLVGLMRRASLWTAATLGSALASFTRIGRLVDLLLGLIDRLPPVRRRLSPWRATLLGGPLVGFGIAGYFRTGADVVVGVVLTIPFGVAAGFLPETSEDSAAAAQTTEAGSPGWSYAVAYTTMAVTGLYSYLRARSSNRRLEASVPSQIAPKAAAERREVLAREVHILVGEGWHVESVNEFEAVVSRIKRPNHGLHLVLSLLTLWLWGLVWIALTISSRRKRELEYRLLSVDLWGNRRFEPVRR